jgi:hypothetical protein
MSLDPDAVVAALTGQVKVGGKRLALTVRDFEVAL